MNPHSLDDIKDDILRVGKSVGFPDRANRLIQELKKKEEHVKRATEHAGRVRVFCAEWLQPLMNAGHWIPEIGECADGVEELGNKRKPSGCID